MFVNDMSREFSSKAKQRIDNNRGFRRDRAKKRKLRDERENGRKIRRAGNGPVLNKVNGQNGYDKNQKFLKRFKTGQKRLNLDERLAHYSRKYGDRFKQKIPDSGSADHAGPETR